MSNRVVAIKILGVGDTTTVLPATFTTRAHPLYPTALEGTVVSLTDQLSSEIAVFGSMGSDSTTSFTVLSTAATRAILLSRGKVEVRDPSAQNQPMRTTGYISPASGPVTIPVPASAVFTVGNYYRIQNTVFKIISNSGTLVGARAWGCANVPIGMTQQGVGNEPLGCRIYDVSNGNPLGGCEQLPVVIETVDLDSITPEVIFRGYISKVSNDTSSGQQNLIKVDCSSMMAYLKSAPFIPAWGAVTADTTRPAGVIYQTNQNADVIQTKLTTPWVPEVFGPRFDPLSPQVGDTVVSLWQVREEGTGGISVPLENYDSPGVITVNNSVYLDFNGNQTATTNSYAMCFKDGYYDTGGYGPPINLYIGVSAHRRSDGYSDANRLNSNNWWSDAQQQAPSVRGENCIESADMPSVIIDLLLGTYNADPTLSQGARSATESAWLPFPYADIGDLIDLSSLADLMAGLDYPDIVQYVPGLTVTTVTTQRVILPYAHTSAKTVGEVLDEILKRLGAYMVYDQGKFYFGSWAGTRQVPAFVNDGALSDPSIKLTFDRGMCLMRVKAKYCIDIDVNATTYEVPYLNVDLASSALGKEMTVSHWMAGRMNPNDSFWGDTRLMANAFGLLMRYSQSAARLDVSLRDSVLDLEVGQQVACTFDNIVNSEGEMGVVTALGYVLKAGRSWKTPTTAYTIILPGYLSTTTQLSYWSCSALVVDVLGGDNIEVDSNAFIQAPILAPPGAPISDVQAFLFTQQLLGSWYDVQLLDTYGTLKYQGALTGVNTVGNLMTLPGFDAYAVPGDIIVLAPATYFGAGLSIIYDTFLADNNRQVDGVIAYSKTWVP